MKCITFAIPCYNSQDYMSVAIESLLVAGDDIEILVIDDGSHDNTLKIAKEYEKKYPNIVRAIHKENGGHGSAVNTGLSNASGLYYKVIDSDDWVDVHALKEVVSLLKKLHTEKKDIDLLITNYVYEKLGDSKVVNYKKTLPENKIFTWNEVGKFKKDAYLLMHSVIYRTDVLKKCGLKLPEHTFYVDNIYVYYPLPHVKKMYYLNTNLYRYFIGRDDQSVNQSIMIKRIDQQIRVTKLMIDFFDPYIYWEKNRHLSKYLVHYIDIMMTVTTSLLQVENTSESKKKIKDIWKYLKEKNPHMYRYCNMSLSGITRLPRGVVVLGYNIARKIYKFN